MVATVGKITAGAGYGYLTEAVAKDRHDYYTGSGEAVGVWAGSGAGLLGLAGEVDNEVMGWLYGSFIDPRTLGGGIDPVTGRPRIMGTLGQGLSKPRVLNKGTAKEKTLEQLAAFDVTFSPSKSVSVLWALAPAEVRAQIVAAHEEAVDAGLAYLEANAGHARAGRGGVRRVDTNGFTVAKFRHRTARTTDSARVGDPQLHTHCAVLNRVLCEDGKWRTLDGNTVYNQAHAAGAVYGTRLEELLSERLGVAWVTPEEGQRLLMREIVGIPKEVRDRFSTRRDQVLALYDKLEATWRDRTGRSPSKTERGELIEQAKLRSRLAKVKGDGVNLHDRWRSDVTDDEYAQVMNALHQQQPANGGRVPAGPQLEAQVFAALEGQRSWWTRIHLHAEVARRIDTPTSEAIELEVERLATICVNLEPDPDDTYRQADRTKFTTARLLEAEARVLRAAHIDAPWSLDAAPEEILGDDQVAAVDSLCAGDTALTTVIGPAGAGKTTMLRSVAASYEAAGRQVSVLTLSAAAARVVTEETGIVANTIASWEVGQVTLPRGSLILVDEASMVPTLTLDKLVRLADAYSCRIGLVGDYAQMGSPEAGGLMRDLASLPSAVEMIAVRRFRNEWERDASKQLRAHDPNVTDLYREHGRLHGTSADSVVDQSVAAWAEDQTAGYESIIVVDNNEQAADVSARCQQVMIEHGRLGVEVAVGRDGCRVRVGDLIQTRKNTGDILNSDGHRILNRDTWSVVGFDSDSNELLVRHSRNHTTARLPVDYVAEHVTLAYAVTISGAQGRTTDTSHVIVTPRTSSAGLYVGMTRGRHSNHAHVVRDGHLHDEFGLGRLSTRAAFEAAVTRNDTELSAHRVRDLWQAHTPEREQARHTDRVHVAAQHWWDQHHQQLPARSDAFSGHHHRAISILERLHPDRWQHHFDQAATTIHDWTHPNIGDQFITALAGPTVHEPDSSSGPLAVHDTNHRDNVDDVTRAEGATTALQVVADSADTELAVTAGPHAKAAQDWWNNRWRTLATRRDIATGLRGHHRHVINTLSHINPTAWDRLVNNTLSTTNWHHPDSGTTFLKRLRTDAPYFDRNPRAFDHGSSTRHHTVTERDR